MLPTNVRTTQKLSKLSRGFIFNNGLRTEPKRKQTALSRILSVAMSRVYVGWQNQSIRCLLLCQKFLQFNAVDSLQVCCMLIQNYSLRVESTEERKYQENLEMQKHSKQFRWQDSETGCWFHRSVHCFLIQKPYVSWNYSS